MDPEDASARFPGDGVGGAGGLRVAGSGEEDGAEGNEEYPGYRACGGMSHEEGNMFIGGGRCD